MNEIPFLLGIFFLLSLFLYLFCCCSFLLLSSLCVRLCVNGNYIATIMFVILIKVLFFPLFFGQITDLNSFHAAHS